MAPGPEDGPPDRIVAKLEWEAAMVQKAAQDNMVLAVMRNTAYWRGTSDHQVTSFFVSPSHKVKSFK